MKSSIYYFRTKTKILVDFQIYISVPLTSTAVLQIGHSRPSKKSKKKNKKSLFESVCATWDPHFQWFCQRLTHFAKINPSKLTRMDQHMSGSSRCYHFVKSAHIRSYSGPYSVRMQENTDQNNSKYGHFLRSVWRRPRQTVGKIFFKTQYLMPMYETCGTSSMIWTVLWSLVHQMKTCHTKVTQLLKSKSKVTYF